MVESDNLPLYEDGGSTTDQARSPRWDLAH